MTRLDGAQSRLSPSSSGKKQRTVAAGTSGAAVRPSALQTGELVVFSVLLGAVALVFLPSLNSQFTLPKLAVFYPCLGIAAAFWVRRHFRGGTTAVPTAIAVAGAALLVWWAAALPFAVDFAASVWGAPGRGNGLALHVALIGLFVGIASLRIAVDDVRRLLIAILAILSIVSVYAIVQAAGLDLFVWPNVRPGSTVGHPVPLAAILALALPIGIAIAASSREQNTLIASGAVTVLILFALGTTLSRGPWIGAACGTVVTIVLLLRAAGGRRLRAAAVALATVIAVAGTVWLARVPGTRVTQRIALITRAYADPSFMNRFEYFSAALAMIRERPLTGSGFETFGLLFPPLRPVESASVDDDTIPTMVHNGYLDRAVWTGVPGLALYGVLMLAVGAVLIRCVRDRDCLEDRRALACGIFGALVAFAIQDLSGWEEVSSSVFVWAIAGLGVALTTTNESVRRADVYENPIRSLGHRIVPAVTALFAIGLAVCAWTTWREAYADARIAAARRLGVRSDWRDAAAILDETRPMVANSASHLDRIAVVYLQRLRTAPDPAAYRAVREVLRRAGAATRFDPYVLVHVVDAETLALLSGLTRNVSQEAVDAGLRAAELDPNNATVHETLARFHLASGHSAAALTEVHLARTLRPSRAGLCLLEGDILRASGDKRAALDAYRAEVALHSGIDSVWVAAQQKVTAAVIETGDYDAALREAQTLVTKVPADATGRRLLEAVRAMRTY